MTKEQLAQKVKDAEDRCRVMFDQLQTANQQVQEITTELERSRGDYRTLKILLDDWDKEEIPEEDKHLANLKKTPPKV